MGIVSLKSNSHYSIDGKRREVRINFVQIKSRLRVKFHEVLKKHMYI